MSIFGSGSMRQQPATSSTGNGCAVMPVIPKTNELTRWPVLESPRQVGSIRQPRLSPAPIRERVIPVNAVLAASRLKGPQHRLGAGSIDLAGLLLLDIKCLDHSVIDQHRIALRALAESTSDQIEFEPESPGEVPAAVGQHPNFAFCLLLPTPCGHDEDVVDGDTSDLV